MVLTNAYLEHKAPATQGAYDRLQREVAQACVVGSILRHLGKDAADALRRRT